MASVAGYVHHPPHDHVVRVQRPEHVIDSGKSDVPDREVDHSALHLHGWKHVDSLFHRDSRRKEHVGCQRCARSERPLKRSQTRGFFRSGVARSTRDARGLRNVRSESAGRGAGTFVPAAPSGEAVASQLVVDAAEA